MKQLFPVILATILFCACGNNSASNSPEVLELSSTQVIDISTNSPHPIRADNAQVITTSEMFDMIELIDYIKLDSSEPMGDQIETMIVTKDKIFILDRLTTQQIFVFNKTGELLFRIKNKGRGPNEYLSVWNMQIDTVRNELFLNDPIGNSYIYFSANDGRYLRRNKGIANCFVAPIDSLYINLQTNGQDFNEDENWAVLVADKDSVMYKGFEFKPIQEGNFIVNSFTNDYDGGLLYTPVYSDTVYQFKSPSSVFAKYVIQQEKSIWTLNEQKLDPQEINKRIKENGYTMFGGHFLAVENYVAFTISHKWKDHIIGRPYFWDKRTDVVYAWDMTQKPKETRTLREILHKPIAVYDNTFFGTFSPAIPEEYRKDLNPKLKKMLDDSQDGDNPIVVMYKLK